MTTEVQATRRSVAELVQLVRDGEAQILFTGSFLTSAGELYTSHGRRTRHGGGGYTNHGCRCDVCKAAESERAARYRAQTRAPDAGHVPSHRAPRRPRKVIPDPDPWANLRKPIEDDLEVAS